ncbi:hypothetical protein J4Q44_G00130960 [Coregonus suidteri]|uniref:Uncharacterized protein n=1 Tax=Coregonus suidteri TaxID=861788 RepID=A0AAN8LU01_9TELE
MKTLSVLLLFALLGVLLANPFIDRLQQNAKQQEAEERTENQPLQMMDELMQTLKMQTLRILSRHLMEWNSHFTFRHHQHIRDHNAIHMYLQL